MKKYVFETTRPIAETKYGKLRGVTFGDVNIFMGVEYAKAKRFHMPVEPKPWTGIKDAYNHGPIAVQLTETNPFAYYRGLHMLEKQSEDCQNLNIWAPKTEKGEKKPVFVWIHGGGFFGGNAFEEISFDGFNMAHNGDIVFVSINHRLNIFGYLNLEDYSDELWNSGNVGLADLVSALKWIHENIAAFGGDPENVTICGHSGGGGKVQCLYQMEEAVPYFQRGICLSGARAGTASGADTRENSRETAKQIMDRLGITKENIDKVYELSTKEIVEAAQGVMGARFCSPIPNDYFPGFPALTKLMPFSKDKPIIYSSTLGEFSPCKLTAEEKAAMTEADKIEYLRTRYGEHTDRLVELFRKAYPDHDIIDLGYYDSGYRLASLISAKKHLEAGCKDVYIMLCAYNVPENGSMPIWHGGEVAYIFQNERYVLVLNEAVYGEKYGKTLTNLVINYVKNGNPNCEYLPQWDVATPDALNTMIIDKECRQEANYDSELVELAYKATPKFSPFATTPKK